MAHNEFPFQSPIELFENKLLFIVVLLWFYWKTKGPLLSTHSLNP